MNILTVPVRVDAFVARETESVVSTTDNFDNLPYVNKHQLDINFDVANIATSIARKPLNGYCQLRKGVHLHWSMPDAMTEGDVEDDGIKMPVVPNRWLVRRVKKSDTSQVKAWVVESDYLYPGGVIPDRAIAIPAVTNKAAGAKNWQYLGRQLPLEQWLAESSLAKNSHSYLPELNVLGWGTPYFSALYTDCYSVFGFYDDELHDEKINDYHYEVYGWYHNLAQDYVQEYLTKPGETQQSAASELAKWVFNLTEGEALSAMVCYGKVVFGDEVSLSDSIDTSDTRLAFAKTPVEALATYLSKRQTAIESGNAESAIKLENQILSLLYNADVEGQDIDFIDRLKSARHKAEFHGISGGELYDMLDDASLMEEISDVADKSRVQDDWENFKPVIRSALSELNRLQEAKNQAEHRIDYQRRMLYNDWSKYMLSLHPADLEGDYYPDIDMLRLLMTQQTIPALEQAMVSHESLSKLVNVKVGDLQQRYQNWKSQFDDVVTLEGKLPAKLLQEISAPRYWQPKEPCILIAGDVVKPSLRHGADGTLNCHVYSTSQITVFNWLEEMLGSAGWQWDPHAVNTWSKQPWSPLMVEWSMNLYPDETASQSIQANQFDYNSDFITSHYRIPLNDEQFGLPSAAIDLHRDRGLSLKIVDQPTVVNGRSLVTDSVIKMLESRFNRYLDDGAEKDNPSATTKTLVSRIQTVSNLLDKTDCTILSLDGLYDDLLMYSNLSLMDVDDPFKFVPRNADMHITDKVKSLLKGHDFKLPAIGHRFTPIKGGIHKLGVVQLVDTFGRFKEINSDDFLRPHRELIGNALYSPPRVLQPLRLSFRWLDNMTAEQTTPIQGWLGYNVFDETILIFDEGAEFLGQINSDGEWCNERGFIQSLVAEMPKQLREYALKLLSFHNNNRIKKTAFISQAGVTTELWQQLNDLGVLREMSADKALLIPVAKAEWIARIEPVLNISFAASRALFINARASNNYWSRLKQAVRRAIDNIEPVTAVEKDQPGTIKPLAIVKAQLDLQLQGGSESDKSWSALKQDLNRFRRSDREYTAVDFPIKLGEYNNLDDGLVAYWQVFDGHQLSEDGYFPQSDMDDLDGYIDAANFDPNEHDYVDQIRHEGVANLKQSLQADPITVLMLMDPDAAVHATTGVVPKKSLYLSPEAYRDVVGNISSRYFMAPLLTPMTQTAMPLPAGETWLWESPTGNTDEQGKPAHIKQLNVDMLSKAEFFSEGGTQADWQWLIAQQLLIELDTQQGMAWLRAPEQALSPEVTDKLSALAPILDAIAQQGVIAISDITPLGDKVRVMEGWLSTSD